MKCEIIKSFEDHQATIELVKTQCLSQIDTITCLIINCVKTGGTVFFCGNGGSAADSQHLAAEFIGRFKQDRPALAAIALSTDTSILTCVGNDYGFDDIFARQVSALVKDKDVLVGISTSGNSKNIINAVNQARQRKAAVIGLLGNDGGELKHACDHAIIIPSSDTARIQESHILIGHIICELVEKELFTQ